METTSYGTGELMLHALKNGCTELIIGIGGSATNDGGIGLLSALRTTFLDENNDKIVPKGKGLEKIATIVTSTMSPLLRKADICVACDVNNPLCGDHGCSTIYGPQKGATKKLLSLWMNGY